MSIYAYRFHELLKAIRKMPDSNIYKKFKYLNKVYQKCHAFIVADMDLERLDHGLTITLKTRLLDNLYALYVNVILTTDFSD